MPVEDSFETQLVETLIRDGRSFVKRLRHNMPPSQLLANTIPADSSESPCALFIAPRVDDDESALAVNDVARTDGSPDWVRRTAERAMPSLPARRRGLATVLTTIACT